MLTELCAHLRNYFLRDYNNPDAYIHHGTFVVSDGQIQALSFLQPGQYFRIIGSVFNDGVWKYRPGEQENDGEGLHDETFTGTIWAMSVPPAFLELADEIAAWNEANDAALSSPYQSESFGGYSYTTRSGSGTASSGSAAYGWQDQFAARLAPYRRLSVL